MQPLPSCPYCGSTRISRKQFVSGGQVFLTPLQCNDCDSMEMEGVEHWAIGNKLVDVLKEREVDMKK